MHTIPVAEQNEKPDAKRREPLLSRLRDAFLAHGYDGLTMSQLADLVGLSRRMLYNHFSGKTAAFRYLLWHDGDGAIEAATAKGRELIEARTRPVEIFVTLMDLRYAENRRRLSASPHALEINEKAFLLARDIMIEAAEKFQAELATLIGKMEADGLLALQRKIKAADLAQMLCDGARGSNQALPPIPIERLPDRHRQIIGAILHGTIEASR